MDREDSHGTRSFIPAQENSQAHDSPRIPGTGTRLRSNGSQTPHGQTRLPSRNIDQLGSTQPMRPQRIARNNWLPAILRPSGTTRPHIYHRANKFLDEIPFRVYLEAHASMRART